MSAMQPERPEEKDKTFQGKILPKKAVEALVTVLFVFASWMTRLCNMPGLNANIVRGFCAKHGVSTRSQNICSTVINVKVSDDQKESAESIGITLIPARRKSTLDPQRHPPKLDWLLHHDIYYPSLGDLKNVKYVVGHNSMTAEAATDIRDSLFPDAELHLLKVDLPGVLVVFDKWDIEKYGLPEFHRNLLKDLSSKTGEQVKVYTTVLDVAISEVQKNDAEKSGVTLIPGKRAEYVDPENDPINMLWLCNHRSYYRDLKDLKNIQFVIGYAPMTAFAAADIRKSLFPNAKLYQINAIHPDHHAKLTAAAQHKLERDMLRVAKESDAMVSIGPSMYGYFENAYRAINERAIPHIELLPKVGECFTKQTLKVTNIIQQHVILSYGEFDCCTDVVSDYSKITESIGQVTTMHKRVSGQHLKWNILGIPTESSKEVEQHLHGLLTCDFEVIQLKPISSIDHILTHIQQCHMCVTGLRHADFGFCGLEAIAAGLPTYVNRDSQLGAFIIKYLSDYEDQCLVNSTQEWCDKVMSAIRNTPRAFKWANKLKRAYYECEEVAKSYARFTALFKEGKEPCDDLDVTIELNSEPWIQQQRNLTEQLEMMSRQQLVDQSAVAALKQAIQEVNGALNQCQQSLKRKAEQTIHENSKKLERLCYEANCGVNRVTNLEEGSLVMLLNFLSILGLYRFKSSVHTGRFAELYEPWLITDGMREIAAKNNLPLKLQVTYDKEKFDELDAFFIKRDGRISDSMGHVDGEDGYRFERQPKSSHVMQRPALHISKLDTDVENKFTLGAMRLILFKLDQVLQSQIVSKECLPRILNIGSSAVLEHISCDVIQIQVEITEKIRRILLSKQEILSLFGIKAFLVTDKELEQLSAEALEAQFEIHGNTVSAISTSHGSLLLRSLLLYNIRVGSYSDLCILDLEHTARQGDKQTQSLILKSQLSKAREGRYPVEKNEATLKELDKANEDDQLDNTMRDIDEVMKELEKVRKEAEVLKTQLDEVKEGKSLLEKLNLERLEELAKAEEVTVEKITEAVFLKEKIQGLETKLAETSELVTKMQAHRSNAETELCQSKDLVTKMQAKLSDAENKALESDTLRDQLDKIKKEFAQLQDQLGIAVKEKKQIQEELDRERKVKRAPRAAAYTEPKSIGGERYIGKKEKLPGRHGGHKWTLQVLGSVEYGTDPGQFNEPHGLAWHGDQLVICDTENHRIQILNKNKVVIEIIRFDGQFDKEFKPYAVAISPDGLLFITDIGNNQIIICDQNKKNLQIIPQSASIDVKSITVTAEFVFVTDRKGKSLIKYNIKDGKPVARVSGRFSFPHTVMATSNNRLLVSDHMENVIHVLDSDLNFLNSYRHGRLECPQGLDVDSHDNIYICRCKLSQEGNSIVKLRSDGQFDCELFEGDEYLPEFIAVNDDITTTIAITEMTLSSDWPSSWSRHQISLYSIST